MRHRQSKERRGDYETEESTQKAAKAADEDFGGVCTSQRTRDDYGCDRQGRAGAEKVKR